MGDEPKRGGPPAKVVRERPPILPREVSVALYVVAALATLVALGVNLYSPEGWNVDGYTLGLIGILVLIPIAERVQRIKVTKHGEIAMREGLAKVESLVEDNLDAREEAVEAEDEDEGSREERRELAAEWQESSPRTIRRIVWVDDEPEGNRIEISVLKRRFTVATARSTAAGLALIEDPDETAVITDAVRVEADTVNLNAGLELIEALRPDHPQIPVYVYCGDETAAKFSAPLLKAGAKVVTSSFDELSRAVRADARASFEAEVGTLLATVGELTEQDAGVDFVVAVGGKRIAVEAKDYRRTPKAAPLNRAMDLLKDAVEDHKADDGLVVVPRDVFIADQHQRAAERGVRLVTIGKLLPTLAELTRPA